MAVGFTKPWNAAVEKNVRDFYETLSAKDRRRFAAVQARQLGYEQHPRSLRQNSYRGEPACSRCWGSRLRAFSPQILG